MITEINELEKEILEEIVEARINMKTEREVFPSGINKEALIKNIVQCSKFSKYFTSADEAEKLAKKGKLILNTSKITERFTALFETAGKTVKERADDANKIDSELGVISFELREKLVDKLDTYMSEYPSMKYATKLIMVIDDITSVKNVGFDNKTFSTLVRYDFILSLKIYVT